MRKQPLQLRCGKCDRIIRNGAPVTVLRRTITPKVRYSRNWASVIQSHCVRCAPVDGNSTSTCAVCKRPMYFGPGVIRYRQSWTETSGYALMEYPPRTCGPQCAHRLKIIRQLERYHLYKDGPHYLTCVVCDEPFDAKRRDAKTCSAKCRVKLHRRERKKIPRLEAKARNK